MSEDARKVLFVCTGNTCRSPMAEGIFRKASEGKGYEVGSAGVAAMPGGSASRETVDSLKDRGIELEGFRSRMVDEEMLKEAEAVFCMTEGHLEMLEMMFPQYEEKYHLACDFAEVDGRVGVDVPDPIGMGRPAYEEVAKVLEEAVVGVIGFLDERVKQG
ncbi:MAG: low molecular weight protein arginine phosphatase [Verrucomicrobiaceae bacterium]